METQLNDIECKFLEAYCDMFGLDRDCDLVEEIGLECQKVIGIYRVDFFIDRGTFPKYAIEIDGHEYHKTKEQREHDYDRERYLLKRGIITIRFTGTEVFLKPDECAAQLNEVIEKCDLSAERDVHDAFERGEEYGVKSGTLSVMEHLWSITDDQVLAFLKKLKEKHHAK